MKRGFTLIELLATIVIIIALALLIIPRYTKLSNDSTTKAYKEMERRLEEAAAKYVTENYVDSSVTELVITKEQLIASKYIDEIYDLKDKSICGANVIVSNLDTNPTFTANLECSNYTIDGVEYTVVFNQLLPDDYQELSHITSNGTQYVSTSVIPDSTTGVHIKFLSNSVSGDHVLFGTGDTNNNRYWVGIYSGGVYYGWNKIYSIASGDISTSIIVDTTHVMTLEMNYFNNKSLSHNGNIDYSGLPALNTKTSTIDILGYYSNGTTHGNMAPSLQLMEFIITKGNDIVGNFVPCYRKSDSVVGLYDMVSKTFYTNNGNGSFTPGSNVTNRYHAAKTQHFVYNTANNLTANTYTRTGYTFAGWNTNANGTGISYSDTVNVNNLSKTNNAFVNLYAQWNAN